MRKDWRRIVIVEDNVEIREAYQIVINSQENYQVVGMYDDCESAIKNLSSDHPDLVLMDLNLPGMSGISGIGKLRKLDPTIKFLVVTIHDDSMHVFDAICAGAIGYITKDSRPHELIAAIEEVFRGGAPMSTKIANLVVKSFHTNPATPLTERETDVLKQLAQGKTYDYIARELSVSKDTVKTHIRHIYDKLQVNNKSEAVIRARKDNLV